MYNLDKEKIKSIIENSCFSEDNGKNKQVRNAFLTFFSELCEYSQAVNESIISGSVSKNVQGILPEICVALMDKVDGDKLGTSLGLARMTNSEKRLFTDADYKILKKLAGDTGEKKQYNGKKRVFINADYETIKKLAGDTGERKQYKGEYIKEGRSYNFQYYLKFNRCFVEMQELLYQYARQYCFVNPVVFSPYSFKAFDAIYDQELENENLNFRFDENGLISSDEKDLFWNINISSENRTYDAKIPYGDSSRYIFEFKKGKKGNYLLPLPANNQTKIYDIDFLPDAVRLTTDHDMDFFTLLEPLEVDETSNIIKALISNGLLFSNKNFYNGILSSRIISEADIEHALAPFKSHFGISCHISSGEGRIVKRYAMKYRPDRSDRKLFNTISREYISFQGNGEFLTDYINYVLEYLEYNYPEIEWVGEI